MSEPKLNKNDLRRVLVLELLDDAGAIPAAGDVLTLQAGADIRWQTPAAGGGGGLEWSLLLMGG